MPERRKTVYRKLACVCIVVLFLAAIPAAVGPASGSSSTPVRPQDDLVTHSSVRPLGFQLNFGSPGIGAFATDNKSAGNMGVNTTIEVPTGVSLTDTQAVILGAFDPTNNTAFAGVGFALAGTIIGTVATAIAYFPNASYAYSESSLLSTGTTYTFDMFHYRGHWWNFTEDGNPITGSSAWENGTYNLGVSTAQGIVMQGGVPTGPDFLGILNRTSGTGAYPSLPTTTAKFAIGTRMPGSTTYVAPLSANVMPQLNASLGVAGIEGHDQVSSLHNNQLTLGSAIKYVGMGVPLWGDYILKVLTSVSLSPTSPTVSTGQSQVFTAQGMNQTGSPISGPSYSWQVSPATLGTLNSTSAPTVKFTAGTNPGVGKLWVNSTYNGTTVSNSTAITVKVAPITLSSVSITPSSSTINETGTQSFTAVPVCTGGTCPATVSYSWSLNNALGTLNSTSSRQVAVVAGSQPGSVSLFLNATLNSVTQGASPVKVTIRSPLPTLTSVAVAPVSAGVPGLGMANFTATPTCTSTCPAVTTYSWSLTNSLTGSIGSTSGNIVQFTAGSTAGTTTLYVNATLNGVTREGNPVPITVTAIPSLVSLSITPTTSTVQIGGTTDPFTATPTCTARCPPGTTYSWTLSKQSLGHLSASSGNPVTFVAGDVAGTVALFANATLGEVTVMGGPVSITVTSPLASVSVAPTSASISTGEAAPAFAATPGCTGACPAGTSYAWALSSSSLGKLNSSSGNPVVFTAGSSAGVVNLFVNATLGGLTVMSHPVPITISSSTSTLVSVAIAPSTSSVAGGGSRSLTATPTCSAACPSGVTYLWSLTNTALGSLNTTTGYTVTFTAAEQSGTVGVFVNATLSGMIEQSRPATVTISAATQSITSVSVSDASSTVQVGGSVLLTASPQCSGGACPTGVSYSWTLSNTLGSLSSNDAVSVTFNAGGAAGLVTVYVNATLGSNTVTGYVTINITAQSPGTTSSGSNDGTMIVVVAVVVVVVVAAIVGVMMMRRRRKTPQTAPAQPPVT